MLDRPGGNKKAEPAPFFLDCVALSAMRRGCVVGAEHGAEKGDGLTNFGNHMRFNKMHKGKVIVFSGLDGAGKSTQIKRTSIFFDAHHIHYQYLWTRGGYTSGFHTVKMFLRKISRGKVLPPGGENSERKRAFSSPVVRKIWLTVAILDLIRVYGFQIRIWLNRGVTVICDRYLLDTLVDFRLNFPQDQVETWLLWKILVRLTPQPDAALLLVIPVEESLHRSDLKGEPFRDSPDTLLKRLTQYQSLASNGSWHVIDGKRTPEEVEANINNIITPLFLVAS